MEHYFRAAGAKPPFGTGSIKSSAACSENVKDDTRGHRQPLRDSQSGKTVDTARRESIGDDAGKRVKGRKRHILVDTLGLLIAVKVHAADISERGRREVGVSRVD